MCMGLKWDEMGFTWDWYGIGKMKVWISVVLELFSSFQALQDVTAYTECTKTKFGHFRQMNAMSIPYASGINMGLIWDWGVLLVVRASTVKGWGPLDLASAVKMPKIIRKRWACPCWSKSLMLATILCKICGGSWAFVRDQLALHWSGAPTVQQQL